MPKPKGPTEKWEMMKVVSEGRKIKDSLNRKHAEFVKLLSKLPPKTKIAVEQELGIPEGSLDSSRLRFDEMTEEFEVEEDDDVDADADTAKNNADKSAYTEQE